MDTLPSIELKIYQLICVCSIVFLYFVNYQLSQNYLTIIQSYYPYNSFNIAFKYGWFNIPKDISDIEWELNLDLLKNLIPWIVLQIIVSKLIKKYQHNQLLRYWYIVTSVLFSAYNFNGTTVAILVCLPSLFYFVLRVSEKSGKSRLLFIWPCSICCLIFLIAIPVPISNETTKYFVQVALFWSLLKCMSYSFDLQSESADFADLLAYVFYLPLFYFGPIINYIDFKVIYVLPTKKSNRFSTARFLLQIIRFCLWMLIYEIMQHFFYVNSFDINFVEKLNNWHLFSIGYVTAHFFYVKYFVWYGLTITISRFEGAIVPSYPKCVSSFRLFSRTWKTFDNGLYKFITSYIYVPMLQALQKVPFLRFRLFSCMCCFLFIFVWHGFHAFVFVWSFLNFFGLCLESAALRLSQNVRYRNYFVDRMSAPAYRRLKCVCSVFLLTISYFSSFVFLTRLEYGLLFLGRSLNGTLFDYFSFSTFLYCMCQFIYEFESRSPHDHQQFHMLSFTKKV